MAVAVVESRVPYPVEGCHLAAGNARQHPHHLSELLKRGFHVAWCSVTDS